MREEIKTARLLLRRFRESDYDDLFEFLSQLEDDEFEGYPGITYENGKEHLKSRLDSDEFSAVELISSGKVIGNIYSGARNFAAKEVGYIINKDYQRQGYAAEALSAVIHNAFRDGVHRVYAECDPRNTASWKLLESVGFRRESHLRQNNYFRKNADGTPIWKDTYVYAILKNDETNKLCRESMEENILETERLFLREMDRDDYDALYRVLADTEIMRHYPYTFDEARVRAWIERNMDRYQEHGFGLWAVCLKETKEMIGDCGLTLQNINGNMLPEIGYHIRRDCQRRGYAKEAAKAVRDWAFRNTDYAALYSYCKYTNEPSIRTAESIGMHFDCEYPDETNGITHVSAISKKDWLNEIGAEVINQQKEGLQMEYNRTVVLKDGRACTLRNGTASDGHSLLDIFNLTHEQTDFLLTYPEEHRYTAQQEADFLQEKTDSADEIELLAELDGKVVGCAGINCVGRKEKIRHRAEFGISVDKVYWGLGIGRALTEACIECAKKAGYAQLELEVVAENKTAIALYESVGFEEYGRNPKGFRSRFTGWQEVVLMRLDMDNGE